MYCFDFPVSHTILLTGAGFTHNFGGFLARSMWAEIHNRFERRNQGTEHTKLRNQIKRNFDYEELYQVAVNTNEYAEEEKSDFIDSVLEAYDALDGVIRDFKIRYITAGPSLDLNLIKNFLSRLAGKSGEKAFFFTLNQDIFVERYFSTLRPVCPGVKLNYARFNIGPAKILEESDYVRIPTHQELEEHKRSMKSLGQLYYVKLHGSYDWRDENNQKKLLIGTNKPGEIRNEPLLSWYFQLFKDVLSLPNPRLLIIGYGFRDRHINQVIANSSKQSNLKVYIISPEDPGSFRSNTLKINNAVNDAVWNAVAGYYPYTFKDLFPYGGGKSQFCQNLVEDFFEN